MSANDDLLAIFDADRRAREAEDALLSHDPAALAEVLTKAVGEALADDAGEDASPRLRRLADLCAQVPGAKMVDALLSILDHEDEAARTEAGEALLDVSYQRFKEVAQAVERALDRGHTGSSMQELPFVLAEVRDPDPIPLIARFLRHPDAQVVAAAITAIASHGDPSAARHFEPLLEDEREVILEELDDNPMRISELVEAALEELGIEEEE